MSQLTYGRMDFKRWTDCPPRAPLNKPDAVYGSFDHLMILLARIADFSTRDRKRKLEVTQVNGGMWKPASGMKSGPPPGPRPSGHGQQPNSIPSRSDNLPSYRKPTLPQMASQSGVPQASPQLPFFGMAPPRSGGGSMPASYQPAPGYAERDAGPRFSLSNAHMDLASATERALQEWRDIEAAAVFFASQLGPSFQPLDPECQIPIESPFGMAVVYRSWDISTLWALYHMCRIILIRSHPHMPPAAHVAAGVAANQTRDDAIMVGRIAAGVPLPPPDQILNPNLAASVCEMSVPLFFAGIQYQAVDQRNWLVERLDSVDRRAGWATAAIIAEGCQTAWIKSAAAGRGAPHERISKITFSDNRVPSRQDSHDKAVESEEDGSKDRKFIHAKAAARLHWGIGIIGVEDDVRYHQEHSLGNTDQPLFIGH